MRQTAQPEPQPDRRRTVGRRLTDRQAAVLELVASGLENKEIAHRLDVSEQAVKEQVSNLLRLLAAPNRAALGDAAATMRFAGTLAVDPEWLRFLFQKAPMHVAILSGPEHRFVAVNAAYQAASGSRALIGRPYSEVFPERQASLAKLDRVYAAGERYVGVELPRRFVRTPEVGEEDGYVTAMIEPLPVGDGTAAGVVVFSVDVTDAVRARQRVHELEREAHAILDALPAGVVIVDRDGSIVRVNEAASRLLPMPRSGARLQEILTLHDPMSGDELPMRDRPLARALRGEAAPEAEYAGVVLATGARVALRISAAPLYDDQGSVRGAVGVFSTFSNENDGRASERS